MPLTNGEIGNGSLENGATCESTMEEWMDQISPIAVDPNYVDLLPVDLVV